jgi:hypothetical protein
MAKVTDLKVPLHQTLGHSKIDIHLKKLFEALYGVDKVDVHITSKRDVIVTAHVNPQEIKIL